MARTRRPTSELAIAFLSRERRGSGARARAASSDHGYLRIALRHWRGRRPCDDDRMSVIDPKNDSTARWVVHHYRWDPERNERRNVVVAAFDD
jgi:hypothetical protein